MNRALTLTDSERGTCADPPARSIELDGIDDDGAGDATECYRPLRKLSPKQLAVIELLAFGHGDELAAQEVGVHRVTVARWRLYNPAFEAALRDRLRDVWESAVHRLRSLVPRALDTLHQVLETGDDRARVRAAVEIIRLAGLGRVEPPATVDSPSAQADPIIRAPTTVGCLKVVRRYPYRVGGCVHGPKS